MLPCRCHKEEQLSSLCFQLNQPLKKIQGTGQGCWSGRGTHSWSAIKWHSGEQSVCSYPQSSRFQLESMRARLPASLCGGCTRHHSPWHRLGQVRMGAHVVQQSIGAALYASLFLSRLPPLCVYLMGISVRCTGVQSHCGLKRISDDRKYVNLLFPSGQREKVQRFNGWWR